MIRKTCRIAWCLCLALWCAGTAVWPGPCPAQTIYPGPTAEVARVGETLLIRYQIGALLFCHQSTPAQIVAAVPEGAWTPAWQVAPESATPATPNTREAGWCAEGFWRVAPNRGYTTRPVYDPTRWPTRREIGRVSVGLLCGTRFDGDHWRTLAAPAGVVYCAP